MDYNDFIVQLVEASDSELVEIWKNRDDYTAEAKSLIEKVLEERELLASAQKEEKAIEQEKQEYNHAELQQLAEAYDAKKIGKLISDKEYAKESCVNDEYFSRQISNSKGIIGRVLCFSFGLLGLILFFIFLFTNEPFEGGIFYSGLFGSILLALGLFLSIQSRVALQLVQKNEEVHLTIEDFGKKVNVGIPFPFRFEYHWEKIKQSTDYGSVSQPRLLLFIWNQNGELEVALREDLGALYKAPPNWPYVDWDKITESPLHDFAGYGFRRLELYKLVKILNGLKQQYEG